MSEHAVTTRDPFIELMQHAEAIDIREISAPMSSDPSKQSVNRSFFVRLRNIPKIRSAPLHDRDYLIGSAKLLLQSEEYVLARNLYSVLLKQNLRDKDALEGLGVCTLKAGDVAQARRCFSAMQALHKDSIATYWLAQCSLKEGNDVEALKLFDEFVVNTGTNAPEDYQFSAVRELGNLQTKAGQYGEAYSNYMRALAIRPDSDVVYVNLGTLEIQKSQLAKAKQYFDKAIQINSQNSRAYCGLGLIALSEQQLRVSEDCFARALELDPMNRVAIGQQITLLEHRGAFQEAQSVLEKYLAKQPGETQLRFSLAAILFKTGKWIDCDKHLDIVLGEQPSHLSARKLKEQVSLNRAQVRGHR